MNIEDKNIQSVMQAIEELIKAGTTFDVEALEKIYHDDLQVVMIDAEGNVNNSDKHSFKSLFETKKKEGSAPLNNWSKLHQVSVNVDKAHVLIGRKVNLVAEEQDLVLSIDLINKESQWQVIREVIFIQAVNK